MGILLGFFLDIPGTQYVGREEKAFPKTPPLAKQSSLLRGKDHDECNPQLTFIRKIKKKDKNPESGNETRVAKNVSGVEHSKKKSSGIRKAEKEKLKKF